MSATIETAFAEIIQEHDCSEINLGYGASRTSHPWTVTLHWHGFSRTGIACVFGFGDTPAQAMAKAIANMRADREPYAQFSSDTLVDFETPLTERDLALCDVRPTATGVML
jgi:hypothetical protein